MLTNNKKKATATAIIIIISIVGFYICTYVRGYCWVVVLNNGKPRSSSISSSGRIIISWPDILAPAIEKKHWRNEKNYLYMYIQSIFKRFTIKEEKKEHRKLIKKTY